ncbi:nucleotidyltransferase family protein [Acidipila sp. 4G-K13]|nr:nucleotidyltransferase family protein [Paracidobacterium acidisoli]
MARVSTKTDVLPTLALLAGGLATRLLPLTESVPKSMLMVAGEPFIAHQLRLLGNQGLRNVVICCGHLGEQIEAFVGDGRQFGLRVRYSYDGDELLGTGGALMKAKAMLGRRFFVMYGDSYLPVWLAPVWDAFRICSKPALMTLYRNNHRWDKSNVEFSSGRILRYAKKYCTPSMQHIDYGLSAMSNEVFDPWPECEPFDLADVYSELVNRRELAGYEVQERFYEIGSPRGLSETESLLSGTLVAEPAHQPEPRPLSEVLP